MSTEEHSSWTSRKPGKRQKGFVPAKQHHVPLAVNRVCERLLPKNYEIASVLRDGPKEMLSISIQCELVTIPRLWKRLSEETLEVVQDVSVLGIRCAPLVLDVTNMIQSSIDMSDEVEVINDSYPAPTIYLAKTQKWHWQNRSSYEYSKE